jgi:anaerobic selenocysteine-containing dehydrogenase
VQQKRIRVYLKDIPPKEAFLHPSLMEELGIAENDEIELVVTKKKRFNFTAKSNNDTPEMEVWVNEESMKSVGVSDNSIATVRKYIPKP